VGITDARKYRPLEEGVGNIAYNAEYELQLAAVARGISPAELAAMPGIQLWLEDEFDMCKADLLAWYRLRNILEGAGQDLQNRHIKRLQQRAKLNRGM
jgi:hypothetical protein